jgi:RelA/SpoT family (p)ppGpp synthetase
MTKSVPVTFEQLCQNLPPWAGDDVVAHLTKAYQFAGEAHKGKRRESRELYVEHDLAVAVALSEMGMEINTLVAGLLHDVLAPHTAVKAETVRAEFGDMVAGLLVGLEKLEPYTDQVLSQRGDDRTLERIRRAILSIVEGDARVILIRLADALQDLRKAGELPPEKQRELAQDVRDIYAPLANRLGVWHFKWELEDLSFRYLQPEEYREIARQLAERRTDRNQRVKKTTEDLQCRLNELGIKGEVTGRPKHIYSIYRKMKSKEVDFDQIYDVRALRVILEDNDPTICYQVLGVVHALWQPIPQEFDDYIARPKPNGYRSLHTAVIDDLGQTLEVQIRTTAMHEESEMGMAAAHWAYKEASTPDKSLNRDIQSLRQLLAPWSEDDDTLFNDEAFKAEVFGERIYVFTPRDDLVDLPLGSTPIDFAYQIHSEVGHRCRGARVNNKMVTLDHKLKSGDKVEIITANGGGPSRDWMSKRLGFTASARTRSKIRQWFRQQDRQQNIQQGREIVLRELRRLGVSELHTLEDIALALEYDDLDEFLRRVGFGDIANARIAGAIAGLQQKIDPDDELLQLLAPPPKHKGLTVLGVSGLETKIAGCCQPIPPQPIKGYITRGRGVTVHTADCQQLLLTEPERWIEVGWGEEELLTAVPLVVRTYGRVSLVNEITQALKKTQAGLVKAQIISDGKKNGVYLVVEVTNFDQLNRTIDQLENLPNVDYVTREDWTGE